MLGVLWSDRRTDLWQHSRACRFQQYVERFCARKCENVALCARVCTWGGGVRTCVRQSFKNIFTTEYSRRKIVRLRCQFVRINYENVCFVIKKMVFDVSDRIATDQNFLFCVLRDVLPLTRAHRLRHFDVLTRLADVLRKWSSILAH